MSQKHYNAAYLVDTANIMKGVKIASYRTFLEITEGTVLDIGCGIGADVLNMAQMNPNAVTFVGVDHDESLIQIAQEKASGQSNISFIVSETSQLPFDSNSIAGVRAERLVQHLINPNETFNEVFRVLKTGSNFVIVETDWSSLSFYNGDTNTANKIVSYLTKDKINNGYAAKKIMGNYQTSGFVNCKIELYSLIANKLSDVFSYLWIDKIITEMGQKQLLSSAEIDSFMNELKAADANDSFICSMNITVTLGQKP